MFRIPGKKATRQPKAILVPSDQLTGLETAQEIYDMLIRSRKRA